MKQKKKRFAVGFTVFFFFCNVINFIVDYFYCAHSLVQVYYVFMNSLLPITNLLEILEIVCI